MSVCRGCAGDGVGHHLSTRTMQVIRPCLSGTLNSPRAGRTLYWNVETDPHGHWSIDEEASDRYPSTPTYNGHPHIRKGPLAWIANDLEMRVSDGWYNTIAGGLESPERHLHDEIAMLLEDWRTWRCRWCHGTGTGEVLSVEMMARAVRS